MAMLNQVTRIHDIKPRNEGKIDKKRDAKMIVECPLMQQTGEKRGNEIEEPLTCQGVIRNRSSLRSPGIG